ncbi:hypothetical protein LRQ08_21650 [Rhodococcus qingshengii]|uniref:hypothetical protein n=1 Tax=Rhodococcus qingshengii TaxID=334542 RepID=UPI0021115102|nr:hypothetical protein [Rhodococcus qingshengii]UUE23834.1 hypothetical protein LRQ08_21650 [Rhodococcus qingshengii]
MSDITDDLTDHLAKAIQEKTGGNVEGKLPEWWEEFIGMVLAELQSAGRLIPAGGMALTAEQVEGLKFALEAVTSVADVVPELRGTLSTPVGRLVKLLRALFPATEPADRVDHGSVDDGMGSEWQRCKADCGIEVVRPGKAQCDCTEPTDEDEADDISGFMDALKASRAHNSTPAEPAVVDVDPRAESQAACLYAKLLMAGEDPGLIFQAVLWAYERVKSTPEIIWLEDLYQAWESRASAEATVNSTFEVPAPAEPAEEETKAEEKLVAHRDSKGDIYVGHALVAFKHRSYEQIRRWFNEAHPGGISERRYRAVLHLLNVEASSPVVPAPAETGPWQRIEDVPANVTVLDCDGLSWSYVDSHWRCHEDVDGPYSPRLINDLAPFVAAEEG